jgi:hypothetical protein
MPFTRIDRTRLRNDIALFALQSLETKRVLRAPWSRPMCNEQKLACRLARLLTERLVLLAWLRGRLHVTAPPRALREPSLTWDPRAYATRIAERLLPDYELAQEDEVRV